MPNVKAIMRDLKSKCDILHTLSVFTWLLILVSLLSCVICKSTDTSSVKFPYRPKPGLQSPKKLWWAKPLTEDLFVAGRLTDRQIKYAGEAGFKSIVSLFTYEDDELGDFGGEHVPATNEAKFIAEDLAGLQYVSLLGQMDDWASVEAVQKLSDVMPKLKRPVLLHCNRGYTITFVTMMYLANLTRNDPEFRPVVTSQLFYETASKMGLDFTMDFTKETVAEITGEEVITNPPLPDAYPEEWLDYWPAIPVYKNWFIAGQINKYHLSVLEATGFKSVINMRKGVTTDGQPSQEIVTLLNINDKTGTYENGGRQLKKNLLKARINKYKPPYYLHHKSQENFETRNPDEFGDNIGYNEDLERQAVENTTLLYHHMSVGE